MQLASTGFYSTDENQKQLVSISPDEGDTQNRKQLVSKLTQTPNETIFRIPWGHHIVILGKCANNKEKALFYVHKTLENQWSRAMLHQLEQELERLRKLQQKAGLGD